MALPTVNSLDFLKGCHPALTIGTYAAAGGTPSATMAIGNVSDVEVEYSADDKVIESDSLPYEQDIFTTKIVTGLKFTMHEADLVKLGIAMSQFAGTFSDPTNPDITPREQGVTDGTSILLVGLPTQAYYQIQLVVDDQSFKSTPSVSNTYTKRTITFWRCRITPKIKHSYKRDDWVKAAVEVKVLYDSSVTTNDKVFKIVDFVSK
jgi:hypothetical protein